jgi:glucosylceramidase
MQYLFTNFHAGCAWNLNKICCMKNLFAGLLLGCLFIFSGSCCNNKMVSRTAGVPPSTAVNQMEYWLTKSDQRALLQKQTITFSFGNSANSYSIIDVDSARQFQAVDGFGYTLTGGSAFVISSLDAGNKAALLEELFGKESNAIGISYLRLSIGASDLDATVFSYDDMPAGQTDPTLANFSLNQDKTNLIPLLKAILAINPALKIVAAPWSAPAWMKDNGGTTGGSLQAQFYPVYARYFVKYIQQMKAAGINIDAVTPQNEPENPNNNPSMLMTAEQEANFIKNNLGPAFQAAGITTKIIAFDHNCDHPVYPISILNDTAARPFISGSAFHLYLGDIGALTTVHNAYPGKEIYFTEQYTANKGEFGGDLKWHLKNVVIGSMRNWSRTALEWNLANDPSFGPHTPGGCTTCKGALTIGGNTITRNVAYYIIAHASKFVPAGSVRIASNIPGDLQNVAFLTPAGKKVLIVENDGNSATSFNIRYKEKWVAVSLDAGAVGTFVW